MTRKTTLLLLLIISPVLNASLFAQEKINSPKLDSLLMSLYGHDRAMGSLSISKGDEILYSRGFGWYGKKSGTADVPADGDTKYRIGSISKTFTAVMILQLVEEGRLKLGTPLSDFFPEVPNAGKITVKQLLNHHSGLYNFTSDPSYPTWHTSPKTRDEMLKIISGYKPDHEPGEEGAYSNSNFVLLGYIIEKVTGSPYAEELKKRIIGKIGLKNTLVIPHPDAGKNEAYSYNRAEGNWNRFTETDVSIPGGAGAISSSSADLCRFAQALFSLQLINAASLKEMTEMKDKYGLGIFRYPYGDRHGYGHTGGIDGFTSFLFYLPDDSVAVAVTLNASNYSTNDIMLGALAIYYNKPYQVPDFKEVELSAALLKEYEGVYASPGFPLKITIRKKDGSLSAQATGQEAFVLTALSEKEFTFDPAGIIMIFQPEPDGKIRQFKFRQGGNNLLFTKEP